MYVYIESEQGLYTVGFYTPGGNWKSESDHDTKESAAKRVHYLNGGNLHHNNDLPLPPKEEQING